jgi:hypothetical protein
MKEGMGSTKMYKILIYNGQVLHFTPGHRQSPCCIPISFWKGGDVCKDSFVTASWAIYYMTKRKKRQKNHIY